MSTDAPARRHILPEIDQVLLRLTVVFGATTTIVAAQVAGARPSTWQEAVVVGLALLTALRPESAAGVGMLVGSAYIWALAPETLSPMVLVAAAGMVLAHASALVAAQGPATMRVDGAQVRRWSLRSLSLLLAAAVVWGLSVIVVDVPQQRLAYALGLTVLSVLAVVATRLIDGRPHR